MVKKIKIIILFCLILTSCADYYSSEARKLESEEKYEEAIVLLDKVIKKKPKNIYALMNRGVDKSLLEDYKGAIEDYSRIIEIDERNTLAYLNRGKNKIRIKDYASAIEDFEKAIKTKGSENMWMDWVENPFGNRSDFDVKMEEIRFERGRARYFVNEFNAALDDFNFCLQKNFCVPESHSMIGMIYISCEMFEEGCKALSKAKELGADVQEEIDIYCKK